MMMNYRYYLKSDIGTTHSRNQDTAFAEVTKTPSGRAFIGIVCDGMGGLSDGDMASSYVVSKLSWWFENVFAATLSEASDDVIFNVLSGVISDCNRYIVETARSKCSLSGTTLSLLIISGGKYYIAQLGDSRIYMCSGDRMTQLTSDHSYVMSMVEQGLMTESEAIVSSDRNILTRCIGCEESVSADFYLGTVGKGDYFLITSDGFHSRTSVSDIENIFCRRSVRDIAEIKRNILSTIESRKLRGEKDNITALAVLVV